MLEFVPVEPDSSDLMQDAPVLAIFFKVQRLNHIVNQKFVLRRFLLPCIINCFGSMSKVLVSDDKLSRVVHRLPLPCTEGCFVYQSRYSVHLDHVLNVMFVL